MSKPRSRWFLISIILAVAAFLAAFGIALAATVQVSQSVGSSAEVFSVTVLADEDLKLFHDEEATTPVDNDLDFEILNLQHPLEPISSEHEIFVRNDSTVDLTMIEPCRSVFINDIEDDAQRIGWVNPEFRDLDDNELGYACDRSVVIAPDEMLQIEINIHDIENDLAPGAYNFTIVFAALGDEPAP